MRSGYSGSLHLGLLQADACVFRASKPLGLREHAQHLLEQAEQTLQVQPHDVPARLARAVANFWLENDSAVAEELKSLAKVAYAEEECWLLSAFFHARKGNRSYAEHALARYVYVCKDAQEEGNSPSGNTADGVQS